MSYADGLGLILDPNRKKLTDDPGNTTPIVLSAVRGGTPSGGSTTVTWTTSQPSSSLVRYGVSPNMGQATSEMDTNPFVTSHSVTLTGLVAGKTYLFEVASRYGGGKDGGNNVVMDGYRFTARGTFVAA